MFKYTTIAVQSLRIWLCDDKSPICGCPRRADLFGASPCSSLVLLRNGTALALLCHAHRLARRALKFQPARTTMGGVRRREGVAVQLC